MFWAWNVLKYVLKLRGNRYECDQETLLLLFFSANSLYCSSTVENDKKDNSLTSINFNLKLLYTYPLYLDKENV